MERDDFCCDVLQARMQEGNIPKVHIHRDVCTYHPQDHEGDSDAEALLAGFPCQAGLPLARVALCFEIMHLKDLILEAIWAACPS